MGASAVCYARAASTMQLPFLSEALIQNFNLLSQKLWVLCRRAVWDPYGAVGAEKKRDIALIFF